MALPAIMIVLALTMALIKSTEAQGRDVHALTSYALAAARGESESVLNDWAADHLKNYQLTTYTNGKSLCVRATGQSPVLGRLTQCVWVGDF